MKKERACVRRLATGDKRANLHRSCTIVAIWRQAGTSWVSDPRGDRKRLATGDEPIWNWDRWRVAGGRLSAKPGPMNFGADPGY